MTRAGYSISEVGNLLQIVKPGRNMHQRQFKRSKVYYVSVRCRPVFAQGQAWSLPLIGPWDTARSIECAYVIRSYPVTSGRRARGAENRKRWPGDTVDTDLKRNATGCVLYPESSNEKHDARWVADRQGFV